MTVTLEWPAGPAYNSRLANYTEHLIDNLAKSIFDIVYDYQKILGSPVDVVIFVSKPLSLSGV